MKKKLLTIGLAVLTAITCCLCSCGQKNDSLNDGGSGRNGGSSLKGTLDITYFKGGYGDAWLKKIGAEFTAINPGVKIKYFPTVMSSSEISSISTGFATSDLYFLTDNMFDLAARKKLADISDVYATIPEGENKTVLEKTDAGLSDYFVNEDGKYYMMSWSGSREGIIYNKSTLDEVYPGGYELPKTTDAMFDMFDDLKAKKVVPFIYSGTSDYLPTPFLVWWAQYQGIEEYKDFYSGKITAEDGSKVLCGNAEVTEQKGRLRSWQVLEKMCYKNNGYTYEKTNDIEFAEAQTAFLGHGAGGDEFKCAFSVNGDWLENEADYALQALPQEIRYMKFPVISSIIETTPTIPDDAKLIEVIDYVDGTTKVAPEGVSEKDIKKIADARKMCHSVSQDHVVGIPANSRDIEIAKAFLVFLASDRAGEIYSRTLNGVVLPYGYNPLNNAKIDVTEYQKSKIELFGRDAITVHMYYNNLLCYRNGFCAFRTQYGPKFGAELFDGSETAQSLFDYNVTYNRKNWAELTKNVK